MNRNPLDLIESDAFAALAPVAALIWLLIRAGVL